MKGGVMREKQRKYNLMVAKEANARANAIVMLEYKFGDIPPFPCHADSIEVCRKRMEYNSKYSPKKQYAEMQERVRARLGLTSTV